MRAAGLVAAAGILGLLAGCAGAGKADSMSLKISYFRSMPNPHTQKPEPVYRVVMSLSWQELHGNHPREPFPRAAGGGVFKGVISDAEMRRYVGLLAEYGLGTLTSREPESFVPRDLKRLASDEKTAMTARVFTVGSDAGHASYLVTDQVGPEQNEAFLRCEAFISRVVEHSLQIRTGAEPFLKGK
jgi:hypothetical protein